MAIHETKTVVASLARTATGSSAAERLEAADELGVELNVTAVSGTSPSMTVSLEWSFDGAAFFPADPVDAFTAATAVIGRVKLFKVKAPHYRVVWTITGTTPSFTFSVKTYTN